MEMPEEVNHDVFSGDIPEYLVKDDVRILIIDWRVGSLVN